MSLGTLQDESDLLRWLEKALRRPGVLPSSSLNFKDLRFGTVSAAFPGSSFASDPVEVEHGLKVEDPEENLAVLVTNFGGTNGVFWEVTAVTDTHFTTQAQNPFGEFPEGTGASAFWIAVSR